MTTSNILTFALILAILVTHVMHACAFSTGLCKQYGHSCLGGHGKRSENQSARLLKYLLKEIYENPRQDLLRTSKDLPDNKDWESPFEKKSSSWDTNSDDILSETFFN